MADYIVYKVETDLYELRLAGKLHILTDAQVCKLSDEAKDAIYERDCAKCKRVKR